MAKLLTKQSTVAVLRGVYVEGLLMTDFKELDISVYLRIIYVE